MNRHHDYRIPRLVVDPEWIKVQRKRGWTIMHPEDFCHLCGTESVSWTAERDDWLTATKAWAAETGREGICCPQCFIDMHEAATDKPLNWMLITHQRYMELTGQA